MLKRNIALHPHQPVYGIDVVDGQGVIAIHCADFSS
jgi:hypothetical protein